MVARCISTRVRVPNSITTAVVSACGSSAWKDKNGTITIQFLNNKVMTKSFSATRQN